MTIKVLDWDLEQWALAAGRYPGFERTLLGAQKLKAHCENLAPGGLAGVEYPMDWEWATEMGIRVASEAWPPRYLAHNPDAQRLV